MVKAKDAALETGFIVSMFCVIGPELNGNLLALISERGKIYVQGMVWEEKNAVRCSIANWAVGVEEDLAIIVDVLRSGVAQWKGRKFHVELPLRVMFTACWIIVETAGRDEC
ncbi:hypothetical protein BDV32DRAFT_147438 [Aspergillus pseudonomiae]|uniref:Uncharacterized protein n=1 Tax=Aspergillus pseudonomiae TaxID=1506151 RepID=A0A5N7D481_9EURO|nr:uncharacterized protein BDV37DRAFT_285919 [Aspergillus pseudonomiae]KAB8262515.1 hypothetical protein BDV32DRAFT_147438 [Aspergillus pseudonomiae]KAE8401222.1 hypothetical protein BDV37DRAFT_285919 [Aspergillus pseudonomiae]